MQCQSKNLVCKLAEKIYYCYILKTCKNTIQIVWLSMINHYACTEWAKIESKLWTIDKTSGRYVRLDIIWFHRVGSLDTESTHMYHAFYNTEHVHFLFQKQNNKSEN